MIQTEKPANRNIFILLSIIYIFLMHLPIPGIGGVTAAPQEYLMWVGILTIILFSVFRAIKEKAVVIPSYLKYFLIYALLVLSGGIFNPINNIDLFMINLFRLIAAFIIWFSLHQFRLRESEKDGILLIMLVSAVIESVFVVIQPYLFSEYIPPVGGIFQQKNLFASWTATGIAISLYFITTERFSEYKNIKRSLIFISLFLLSAGIVLASSRAGLIGAALAITVLFATNSGKYAAIKRHLAVWILVFVVGMGGGFYLSSIKGGGTELVESVKAEAKEKVRWMSDTGQKSYRERLLMYRTSYEMFKERPVFGQGFSNFSSLYMYHQAEIAKDNPGYTGLIRDYISHPHNEFFYILAECGIAGIAAVIIALIGVAGILIRRGIMQAGVYVALLIPIVLHMMVEYPLKLSTAHYLLFLILLFMLTSNEAKEKGFKTGKGTAVAVILVAGMLYIGIAAYTLKTFEDYMNFTAFRIKFIEEKGVVSDRHITSAMKNIYLRNWALPDYMYKRAIGAAAHPGINREFIDRFLRWNKGEKLKRPVMKSFYMEGMLLYFLGSSDRENAMLHLERALKTTETGLYLYPNDRYLKTLKRSIISSMTGAA